MRLEREDCGFPGCPGEWALTEEDFATGEQATDRWNRSHLLVPRDRFCDAWNKLETCWQTSTPKRKTA